MPRDDKLSAIAEALGISRVDLIPPSVIEGGAKSVSSAFSFRDAGGGKVWVELNRAMPAEHAYRIHAIMEEVRKLDDVTPALSISPIA